MLKILILSIFLFSQNVTAVELVIKNDLNPREDASVITIENAVSIEAPKNRVTFKVEPGEVKTITAGNVRSFLIVRSFSRHKLKYDILCPKTAPKKGSKTKKEIITVAKAHENSLPGGCVLARIGHSSKLTGTNWEVVDKKASKRLLEERKGNSSLRRN